MKDIKLVFRCVSYLHFHYLVNTSKSQVCAKSCPGSDHPKINMDLLAEDHLEQRHGRRDPSASIWGKRWVTCDLEPGGITQHRLRNNVSK